jgi:hypothetical protein
VTDDEWIGSADKTSRRVLYLRPDDHRNESTPEPTLQGLAANPAAPAEVLLQLLQTHPDVASAALRRRAAVPARVLEAMLRHPHARVRSALAGNRHIEPQVRLQLVDDPDPQVVASLLADRTLPLPDHVFHPTLDRLNKSSVRGLMTPAELAGAVWEEVTHDRRVFGAATRHPEPRIRLAAIPESSPSTLRCDTVVQLLQTMTHDESPEVRAAATDFLASRDRVVERRDLRYNGYEIQWILRHQRLSRALVDQLVTIGNDYDLEPLAANPSISPDVVNVLFDHPAPGVRRSLAGRPDLTPAQLARLAADPDPSVRTAVSVHPALSEEQRADIDIDVAAAIGEGFAYTENPWNPTRPVPSVEQSTAWAHSVNPLLRRRAARDHRLPTELVPALADDTDLGVRVLLAHYHPDAPPWLLLRAFREYPSSSRGRLPWLPNFPTAGLARLADDPDPAVRQLVALDPLAPPDLINRLTQDTDNTVRYAMARCPRLPLNRIIELLDHVELAEPAATNRALPVALMWDLLTRNERAAPGQSWSAASRPGAGQSWALPDSLGNQS